MQKQSYIKNVNPISLTNLHPINNIQNQGKKYILYKKSLLSYTLKKTPDNQKVIIDCKDYNNIQQNKKIKYSKLTKRFSRLPKNEINNNITNDTSDNNNIEFHSTILNSSKSTYSILLKKNSKIKNNNKCNKIINNDNKKENVLFKKNMMELKKTNNNKFSSTDNFGNGNNCKKNINSKLIFSNIQIFKKNNRKLKFRKNISLPGNYCKNKTVNYLIKKNKSQFYNKKKLKFNISQNNKNNSTTFLDEKRQQMFLTTKKSYMNTNKKLIYNKNNNGKKLGRIINNTKSFTTIFHNHLNNLNNSLNKTANKEFKINKKIKTIKLTKIPKKNAKKNKSFEKTNNNNNNNLSNNTKPTYFSSFIKSEKNGGNGAMMSTRKIEEFHLNKKANNTNTEFEVNNFINKKFTNFIEHMKFFYINPESQKIKQDNSNIKESESKFLNYDLGQTNGPSLMLDSILHSNINNTANNIDNNKNFNEINHKNDVAECEKTVEEIEKLANEMFANSSFMGNDIATNEDFDIEEFKEGEDIQKILSLNIKTRQ